MFKFFHIHTVPTEEDASSWLQLFFDLVYVAILVELGNRLAGDLSLQGVIEFTLFFIPIWWSWLEFVDYGRRFPIDDIGQRILTVVYIGVMLALAFEIHALTDVGASIFIFTYALSNFVLALMYGRAWKLYPVYRQFIRPRIVSFAFRGILWCVIVWMTLANEWLLVLFIVLGAFLPALSRFLHRVFTHRADLPQPTIKYHFTLHRFGELTIIVLGEFFIKLATSSSGRELTPINYLIGAGLLAISVSLWWLYFDHMEHTSLKLSGTRLRLWTYSHYPFMAAIIIYGVVGNKVFATIPRTPLDDGKRMLFATAVATAVAAYGLIEWASVEKDEPLARTPQPWIRAGGAVALLLVGVFGISLNVGWLVALVTTIMVLQIILDVSLRLQRPEIASANMATGFGIE